MTKEQRTIVQNQLIILDMKDVQELTGWCENVVRNTFAYDEHFPAIKKGKKLWLIPTILPPIPMQKLSKERAKPKNTASLASIVLDLSKSEEVGFFKICTVMPKHFIKKE